MPPVLGAPPTQLPTAGTLPVRLIGEVKTRLWMPIFAVLLTLTGFRAVAVDPRNQR